MVKVGVFSRKWKVGAVLLVLLVAGAAYLLGWSAIFTVKQINVVGAPTSVEGKIIEQTSQVAVGEKMARLEPRVVRTLLRNITWLDHSSVTRSWFHGVVVIRVWPRTPIATYQGRLIDEAGIVFDLPNFTVGALPYIFAKDQASARFAISLLTALPATLRSELVGVAVVGLNSATLTLREPSQTSGKVLQVAWGDTSNMELKVQVYQALIALPENANITEMDLSAPHAPIVK